MCCGGPIAELTRIIRDKGAQSGCIICGEGVSIPIRASFDDLEEFKRPASEDPSFSQLWTNSGGEEEMVMRTVQRWRAQGR